MTGYKSKRAAAKDKLEQWDTGWQAALAQPAQEPVCPECKAGVLYECVACSSNNYPAQPAQEPASVTYKEVQDSMNALEKGTLYQQVIAEELGQRKLYTTPPAAQQAQEPFGYLSIGGNPIFQKEKPEIGRWETLYTTPPQRTWVEPTGNEWFEWWRVSKVANETEAEIDFADFLIIAQAVSARLKEKNNAA